MHFKVTFTTLSLLIILFPSLVKASPEEKPQHNYDSQQPQKSRTNNNSFTSFKPPNKSQPQHTVGGATRGDTCAIDRDDKGEITALVPEEKQSLTLQSHPSFFAYVSPLNGDKSATLIVKDEIEDYYFSQQLNLPASGGIVKMTLDRNAPPLEVGKDYIWFLRIQCNADLEPEDPQINARIARVQENIPALSQNELVLFYANSQIWYDSLNTAFVLSQLGEDFYWSQLLTDISMGKLIAQ